MQVRPRGAVPLELQEVPAGPVGDGGGDSSRWRSGGGSSPGHGGSCSWGPSLAGGHSGPVRSPREATQSGLHPLSSSSPRVPGTGLSCGQQLWGPAQGRLLVQWAPR